ncbi:MAG: hypothetical protein K2K77_00565 [Duncaniella sp.]|nr:hypothetical protein [Duncaniella sp.]
MPELNEQISSIWVEIKETLKLNLDYAKLTATEKVTVLMSTMAIALVCFAISTIIIFLISLGLMLLLAKSTGLIGACMIMAGIYAVILVAVILLRKQLLFDPVARFISHLFLK